MRIASRLTVLATVAVAGLGLTAIPAAAIPAAASLTPHTRTAAPSPRPALSTGPERAPGASRVTPLWVSRLHLKNGGTTGYAVAASPNGSTVFATGLQRLPHDITHGVTVAYNATTGAQIWQSDNSAGTNSGFSAIAVSPDGSTVFVTGRGNPITRTQPQIVTVAYNAATGAVLWTQEVGSHATGGQGIAVSKDGSTVFVVGVAECGKPVNACYVTAAYNAATGAAVWTQELQNRGAAFSLALSPNGSAVFVTGVASVPTGTQTVFSTIGYNAATGATLWTASYPVETDTVPKVAVSASAVFVTGSVITGPTSTTAYRTIAYAASSGTQLWQKSFSYNNYGGPAAIVTSPDGSKVFVTGSAGGTASGRYGTVAYDATTGAQLWKALYLGSGAADLAVSPDGSRVFVTGDSPSLKFNSPQYGTVAYDSGTGAQLWAAHYGDAALGASYAYGLAVSPDGSKVFVTGGNLSYLTTLAYRS